MRQTAAFALLLLAGCGTSAPPAQDSNGAAAPPPGAPDNRIECQVAGAAAFERACTVETAAGPNGRVLTIRKADGGFRRLLVTNDGHGVVAADGAEPARVMLLPDHRIEVAIGADRFRLPAMVRQ